MGVDPLREPSGAVPDLRNGPLTCTVGLTGGEPATPDVGRGFVALRSSTGVPCVSAQKPASLQARDAGARPDPTYPTGSTEVGAVPPLAVPG
jgi:hypothetical protein